MSEELSIIFDQIEKAQNAHAKYNVKVGSISFYCVMQTVFDSIYDNSCFDKSI